MKICLVPYPILRSVSEGSFYQTPFLPYLPLGILTLGTLLEQTGHKVAIVDPLWGSTVQQSEQIALGDPEYVAGLIQAEKPDLVGFSTILSSYPLTIRWAEAFRRVSPVTPILLGGPQATCTDQETLQSFPWIDLVLRGEAEHSILPLVRCLESKGDLSAVPGLTWRNGEKVVRNPDAKITAHLDDLPSPAYHLYPMNRLMESYRTPMRPYHQMFPLEAGRGCPYKCTFCSTSSFFKRRYRTKSVDRLIGEMATLNTEYGLNGFDLTHDLFTCNRKYILDFCHRLREKQSHRNLTWECYSRIDTIDHDILTRMAEAGCKRIFYGIETGSARMQGLIGKNLPLDRAAAVVKGTLSLGMQVTVSFIVGFPQERPEDLYDTVNLALEMISLGAEPVVLLPLSPVPGSQLFREFGDSICYDEQWSDMFFGVLGSEERKIVLAWPQVFASSYRYQAPGLDQDLLLLLLRIVNSHPRILAALSGAGIDLMAVLSEWPDWHTEHWQDVHGYYQQRNLLFSDFLTFMAEVLRHKNLMTADLEDFFHYQSVLQDVARGPESTPIRSEKFSADVPALMQYWMTRKPVPEEARHHTTYFFWKSDGKTIVQRLTPALAELLELPPE